MKSFSHTGIPSPLQFPATPLLQSSVASSLLRVFACSNEIDRSSRSDVEEEVVVKLDDSPGITSGTKFSVLQKVCFPFWVRRGSTTTGPLIRATVLFAKFAKGTIRHEYSRATAQ